MPRKKAAPRAGSNGGPGGGPPGRVALRRRHPGTVVGDHAVGRRDPHFANHRHYFPHLAWWSTDPAGRKSRRLNALGPAALVEVGMSGGEGVRETVDALVGKGNARGDP